MKNFEHAPAYVLEIRNAWRVVVPIRGKLTPRIGADIFPTRSAAEAWLLSDMGVREIDTIRKGSVERHRSAGSNQASAA